MQRLKRLKHSWRTTMTKTPKEHILKLSNALLNEDIVDYYGQPRRIVGYTTAIEAYNVLVHEFVLGRGERITIREQT